jgi:hypothetical protein
MPFKPKIQECTIELDGESHTFYVRRARADQIFDIIEADEGKELSKRELQERNIRMYVVNKDGSPVSDDEVKEMFQWEDDAFTLLAKTIQEKVAPRDPAKKS